MLAVIGHLCTGNSSVLAVIRSLVYRQQLSADCNRSLVYRQQLSAAVIRSLVYRQQLSAGCDQVTCVQVTAQCWL